MTLRDAGLALGDQERLEAALALFRELGVSRRVTELEGRIAPVPPANAFHREGDVWTLGYAGRVVLLKDVKGLRDLATLVAHPGREVAASHLASAPGAVAQAGLGDVVDQRARDAYKARLLELDDELEEADAAGDAERSARAHDERAAILAQLAGAFGLGGRPRRVGDDTERARQAVTWRIRDALARIEAVHPELGQHLRRSVRTGTFCLYAPAEPVDWSLVGIAPRDCEDRPHASWMNVQFKGGTMAKIAKLETSTVYEMEGFEGRYEDLEGTTVGFETYTEDADPAPLFQGLPDDRCQCPHWGVVVRGTLVYRLADGTENVIGAGEAYSVGPGHLPLFTAGTELIEFSPTDEFTMTVDVVMANLAAMTASDASS